MINVIMPCGGAGTRFQKAGYELPKHLLEVDHCPMYGAVFSNILNNTQQARQLRFHLIFNKEQYKQYNSQHYIMPTNVHIYTPDVPTKNAPEAVLLCKDNIPQDEEVVTWNCDQLVLDLNWFDNAIHYYRKNNADGGILSFIENNPKWSFVKINGRKVIQVAEKQPISEIATVGCYYFKTYNILENALRTMMNKNVTVNGEFYTAPCYNEMLLDGLSVYYYMINEMIPLGTPVDYEYYLEHGRGNL